MKWKLQDLQKWKEQECCKETAIEIIILDISDNNLVEIPTEIKYLTNLKIFVCIKNQIEIIPKEIGELYNIQTFDCRCKDFILFS